MSRATSAIAVGMRWSTDLQILKIKCGRSMVEGNTSTYSAAAFAASLKLDSSHRGLAVSGRSPAER